MIKNIVVLIIGLFIGNSLLAQGDLYLVNVKGKVIDIIDSLPIAYAHVINPRVHGGTITDVNGDFSLEILTEDTLIFRALGYVDQQFVLDSLPMNRTFSIVMKPVNYPIREVTVKKKVSVSPHLGIPAAKPLDVPIELRGDAYNEKPPLLAAFLQPISFAQYYLSKKEKNKRKAREILKRDEKWGDFARYHNLDNITRITGLKGVAAEKFLIYCNVNNNLAFTAAPIEIETQIIRLYEQYVNEKAVNTK